VKSKIARRALLAIPLISLAAVVAGCGTKTVTTSADQMACVYGDQKHGQRLVAQIPPSANPKQVGSNDSVVYIPASNRFFMAALDDSIRDPRAPKFYLAYAKGSVPVQIQGQIRFRFNPELACQWYAKHGRRNADASGDLGFNARGADEANTGWARWLAENFGVTMQQAAQERLGYYNWPALVYNYPDNADQTGLVAKGKAPGQLDRIKLGQDLGKQFTADLNANLGGDYFCGVESSTKCLPLEFQVIDVTTQDPSLMTARAQVEKDRQNLANTEAQLQIGNQELRSADQQQKILQAQLKADQLSEQDAILQAQIKHADCIVLARYGLDCSGNRPANGVTVNQSGK